MVSIAPAEAGLVLFVIGKKLPVNLLGKVRLAVIGHIVLHVRRQMSVTGVILEAYEPD